MKQYKPKSPSPMLPRRRKNVALRLFHGLAIFLVLLATPEKPKAQEKSLLWKVRSGQKSIYILGSIHFLKKENYPLKKDIEDAFDSSKKLVLEIDLQKTNREMAQQITMQKAVNRD